MLAASSSLCQQDPEAHGGNFYSLPHGAGHWCLLHGVNLTFFFFNVFQFIGLPDSFPLPREAASCPDVP